MTKPFVFVLMPFDPTFDDIYKLGIKAAAEDAGAYCERVDEQYYEGQILERIYNQIGAADFIVSDMSGRNPNVFYETGYAHALNKNVILLVNNSEDIPFDLKHHPHLVYNGKISFLKEELSKRLNFFISNPTKTVVPSLDGLEFSINGVKLENDVEIEIEQSYYFSELRVQIDVHNTSEKLFDSGFEISLESSAYLYYRKDGNDKYISPIVISDKRVLHKNGRIERIHPNSYESKTFLLDSKERKFGSLIYSTLPFILRISNEIKSYKIPFKVKVKLIQPKL